MANNTLFFHSIKQMKTWKVNDHWGLFKDIVQVKDAATVYTNIL